MIMIGDREVKLPTSLYRGDKMLFPHRQATDSELLNPSQKFNDFPVVEPDPYVYLTIDSYTQSILENQITLGDNTEEEYSVEKQEAILRLADELFGDDEDDEDSGE